VSVLHRGDSVPHFAVRRLEGEPFHYSTIWQHKNLLLVTIPALDSESTRAYVANLTTRVQESGDRDIECVITQDRIPGISAPAAVVADRWGEIVFAVEKSDIVDLPAPQELMEWLKYVRHQCPECEGEAR
jgi:hypothetical protein